MHTASVLTFQKKTIIKMNPPKNNEMCRSMQAHIAQWCDALWACACKPTIYKLPKIGANS